jgi:hypothetical protein
MGRIAAIPSILPSGVANFLHGELRDTAYRKLTPHYLLGTEEEKDERRREGAEECSNVEDACSPIEMQNVISSHSQARYSATLELMRSAETSHHLV